MSTAHSIVSHWDRDSHLGLSWAGAVNIQKLKSPCTTVIRHLQDFGSILNIISYHSITTDLTSIDTYSVLQAGQWTNMIKTGMGILLQFLFVSIAVDT